MPLLLLLPILLLVLLALALLLWPLALWQRYRIGKSRRRALSWVVTINAVGSAISLPLFVLGAWIGAHWIDAHWIDGALVNALAGLLAGGVLGALGVWLTRFDAGTSQLHYTPNPWVVLALTGLVAVRVLLGAWQAWHRLWHDQPATLPWPWLASHASLMAMAGLLLGYYATYAWGLRQRTRRHARRLDLRIQR